MSVIRKKLIRRTYPLEREAEFAAYHPVLRRVYAARAVDPKTLDRTLDTLLPYHLLSDIDRAVELLTAAIIQQKNILIIGDFDTDGATSTALAVRALRLFGTTNVQYLVPNRFNDGYGLTPALLLRAKLFNPQLIVTVDNGIAHHAGVLAAIALGIEVVITDHHLPAPRLPLPEADAIVNPNQPGDLFPSKCLAGVGVIFYVMLALCRHLTASQWFEKNNQPIPKMSRFLDLVALGTVADLVPLDHNNRILVHQGLGRIRQGQCVPGIVALLECAKRSFTRIVAADLGFAVASRLNAAGRLEDMAVGIECLLCDDATEARNLARTLHQLNDDRRVIEKGMHDQALKAMQAYPLTDNQTLPKGLALFDETWHPGVVGILAARMKERFNRPVVAFAPASSDTLRGSARSIPSLHIRDALALVDAAHPEWQMKFGGHAMAAGVTIAKSQFAEFAQAFDAAVATQINDADLEPVLFSDGELHANECTLEVAKLLRDGGPWGQAFPEALFDDTFTLLEQRIVGEKHLKLKLGKQDQVFDAIAFFVDTTVWPNHRTTTVHAAFRLDVNEYQERQNLQLIVDYLEPRPPGSLPLEI